MKNHAATNYTNAIDTLMSFPDIISVHDVCRILGIEPKYASIYLKRWSDRDLITRTGPSTGVYINRIKIKNPEDLDRNMLLKKILGRPFALIGLSSLSRSGWTSQHVHLDEIAVFVDRTTRTIPKIDGYVTCPRPSSWWKKLRPLMEPGVDGILTLQPGAAYLDRVINKDQGSWIPDPDDMDFPDDAMENMECAMTALGLSDAVRKEIQDLISDSNFSMGY